MEELDKVWHLSENEDEKGITEFELQLWRLFWTFHDWMESCQKSCSEVPLSGLEIAIIHTIRQNTKPKTLSDLARNLKRSDSHSVRYSIKKLLKHELIEKIKGAEGANQKNITFGVTEKGITVTNNYAQIRKKALIPLAARQRELGFLEMSEKFIRIKTLYEEAERAATTYESPLATVPEEN